LSEIVQKTANIPTPNPFTGMQQTKWP